jgi:heat shock protein HtpX
MVGLALRALMAVVGVAVLAVYAAVAALALVVVGSLLSFRSDPLSFLLVLAAATSLLGYLSYLSGTRRLLAGMDAVPVERGRAPGAYARLDRLVERMAVEPPTLYVARLSRPNAFALGGARRGAVVVDRTLFRVLDGDAFEALVAHELAHLEANDALVQTLAYAALRTLVTLVVLLLSPLLFLLTGFARAAAWVGGRPATRSSPFDAVRRFVERGVAVVAVALTLPLLAFSRRREFAADERAAEVSDPVALARALRTLERASMPDWGLLSLLYTRGDEREDGGLGDVLSTHPSTDERVERLLADVDEPLPPSGRRIPVR